MSEKYFPPKFYTDSFHCPHCGVYSHQEWFNASCSRTRSTSINRTYYDELEGIDVSICSHCEKFALWFSRKIISPRTSSAPLPVENMPKDVKEDYLEARNIVSDSPRAAAALLRLSIQKLMKHLGEEGKYIDKDIASLVEKGLPEQIQKGLDFVRIIGNNAVHPGEIDLTDDIDMATALFSIINMIVNVLITQEKELNSFYGKLPEGARKAIEKRDKKNTTKK